METDLLPGSLYLRTSILKGKPGVDEMLLKRISELFST